MCERITQLLEKLFGNHRIVFWYDDKEEFRAEFEDCVLSKVEKIEINNNEFAIKYRVLREQPKQQFLLYKAGPVPDDTENWLLDVQLAHETFKADQPALLLADLGLDQDYRDLVEKHAEFFKPEKNKETKKRKETLRKSIADGTKTHDDIRRKMLAICTNSNSSDLKFILLALIQELADGKSAMIDFIGHCNLESFLWKEVERYGYESQKLGIKDFVFRLFENGVNHITSGDDQFSPDAMIFFSDWMNDTRFKNSFEYHSDEYAKTFNLHNKLGNQDFRKLAEFDYFRVIDFHVLAGLSEAATARSHTPEELLKIIDIRRRTHWFVDLKHHYSAIEAAILFFKDLNEAVFEIDDFDDGIKKYCSSWFRLDQHYRNFIFHFRKAENLSHLQKLYNEVENHYTNMYLRKVNDLWQAHVDSCSEWRAIGYFSQNKFFEQWVVRHYLKRDVRICVIISDALRYEIAEELSHRINQENRIKAELDVMLAMLPSYTQLGMAALLPNKSLEITETKDITVLVDEQTSQGTSNRAKILQTFLLQTFLPNKATQVLKLEELLAMNVDPLGERLRACQVTYIYHNRIDKTGDDRDSESRLCDAVDDAKEELFRLVKKMMSAKIRNVLITTDHGFIFQNRETDESEFSSLEATGEHILSKNRRFVVGKGLEATSAFRKFSAKEIKLSGNVEVLVPKSINRLRLQGAGSRYVHGGASLQEVVLPVIKINLREEDSISFVDVRVINRGGDAITTGQKTVTFYQEQPVSDKVRPRSLRIGFYSESGKPISNVKDHLFASTSEDHKDREVKITFFFDSKEIEQLSKQATFLKLNETVGETSMEREYDSVKYDVKQTFFSDNFF